MTIPSATVRTALLTAVLLAALVLAYLVGVGRGDEARAATPATAQASPDQGLGTMTMTGTGEVTGVPDEMRFRVAVTRKADDVATAMDGTSRTMTRVLTTLEREGVARKDTQSTRLSVDPEYDWSSSGPPVLTGYRVRQSASVLVRDLRAGGRAIAAAVGAGGNAVRVSGIGLRIGDEDALVARARAAAVDEATAKAEQYAEATGQELGGVLTVREGRQPGRVRPPRDLVDAYRAADTEMLKAVPVRAGRADVRVLVTVVWALEG